MKKVILLVGFLMACFAVQSQNFYQGYMIINKKLSVYNEMSNRAILTDSTLSFPGRKILKQEPAHIDSVQNFKDYRLLFLNTKDVVQLSNDTVRGRILTIIYKNGRLVMWEHYVANYEIDLNEN